MWTYSVAGGALARNGAARGAGYSGFGEGRNNIGKVKVPMVGPIPPGRYRIGPAYRHARLGPVTMNLDPMPGTDCFGRSLFRIHGDNATRDASHGCIILARPLREAIASSGDRILDVIV
jgi:lipoprotein-anchoring transpeptidase ErfK/SrfK